MENINFLLIPTYHKKRELEKDQEIRVDKCKYCHLRINRSCCFVFVVSFFGFNFKIQIYRESFIYKMSNKNLFSLELCSHQSFLQ